MKLKWNRKCSIFVLFMFITVTFASFNTNLFIDGRAYVRANDLVRITNIELVENTNQAYETYAPEYTSDTITINTNLPKQNSTAQYRITITNNSDYDYDVQDIIEETYSNTKISYTITGLTVDDTVLEAHTTSTFLLSLSNNTTITEEPDVYQTKIYTFEYTGLPQEYVVPQDGTYKIELWGASGGGELKGLGAYTKGDIELTKGTKIYIYVGESGKYNAKNDKVTTSFNGGGSACGGQSKGCASGGGATDIRLVYGKWNDSASLKSRIIVAAGGGGAADLKNAGSGGGLFGYDSDFQHSNLFSQCKATGGSQIIGGNNTCYENDMLIGRFGIGGYWPNDNGSGGSGYYGGASGYGYHSSGAGGSSFISGHKGCIAIASSTSTAPRNDTSEIQCEEGTEDIVCSKHYSNYVFSNTIMIDGQGYNWTTEKATTSEGMPTHDGTSIMTGNVGDGYAKITATLKVEDGSDYDFDYTGDEQLFNTPYTGIYKLETWGAQGGDTTDNYIGGYGSYSRGQINLNSNQQLHIYVGGAGLLSDDINTQGGYNGGGIGSGGLCSTSTQSPIRYGASGGGATHIATQTGLLSTLENNKDSIIIVSGGGGGAHNMIRAYGHGASAGGMIGNTAEWTNNGHNYYVPATGGTQTEGGTAGYSYNENYKESGSFGQGGNFTANGGCSNGSGGGGGYYGGGSGQFSPAGGGSGYIGSENLTKKIMYCYNCQESQAINTKTVSTTSHSKIPKQNVAKEGNGYSRITLVQRQSNNIELKLKFDIQRLPEYNITYDLDGGTSSDLIESYTRNTDTFTIPAPTKEGYTFVGWTGGANIYKPIEKYNNSLINIFHGTVVMEDDEFVFTATDKDLYFGEGGIYTSTVYHTATSGQLLELNGGKYLSTKVTNPLFTKNYICFYDEEYNKIDAVSALSTDYTVEIPEGAKYATFRIGYSQSVEGETYRVKVMVSESDKIVEYEPYLMEPESNITIRKGLRGNRIYRAVWQKKDYSIEYDLDGGTISNQVTTYNIESENINLPTPTKEGYEFLGWTGGKNLFDFNIWYKNRGIWENVDKIYTLDNTNKTMTSAIPDAADFYSKTYPTASTANSSVRTKMEAIGIKINTSTNYTLSYELDQNIYHEAYLFYYKDDGGCSGFSSNGKKSDRKRKHTRKSDAESKYLFFRFDNESYLTTPAAMTVGNIQIEKGNFATSYEPFISTPTQSISIPTGSAGNRIYHANWRAIDYDIEYDLNGGTITNEPPAYNISSNNITLPTPTKEGYFFAGWTGGKNLYNPNGHVAATVYGINNTINEDGSITSIGTATKPERWTVISNSYSVNKYITTGEQYTLSQKDSQNKINATTYIQINDLAKNSEDTNKYYYITNSNVTFTADDNYNHNVVVQTAKYGGAEVNITNYFQLEKGAKATAYEKYINVPQENLVIANGSQGHRFYIANWETRGIGDYNILSGWVDGDTGEVLSGDPHDRYPDPYYTKIMKLTGGKTYTVQGGISGSDVRWRIYDLNGKYTTYVQGESFTPQSDCYVRILLIQNVTESVKQNFSITETQ